MRFGSFAGVLHTPRCTRSRYARGVRWCKGSVEFMTTEAKVLAASDREVATFDIDDVWHELWAVASRRVVLVLSFG